MEKTPSQDLLAARRSLDNLSRIELVDDWSWNDRSEKWVLQCRLSIDIPSDGPIPSLTNWYILVDSAYPWGAIKFYPAKEGGIVQPFPHQEYNGYVDGLSWRSGALCLDTDVHILGRHGYDTEPYGVHERLHWHCQRALDWLTAASHNELTLPDDPFELPKFLTLSDIAPTLAFCEGPGSFALWQDIPEQYGLLDLSCFREKPDVFLVKCFSSIAGKELFSPRWGHFVQDTITAPSQGIWLRLNTVPVLPPWQAPHTWGELREACREQNIDIDRLLKLTVQFLRDGKMHIALFGFPIPAQFGEAPCLMHWQAMKLPILSHGNQMFKGFRRNEKGYWQRDRMQVLRNDVPIVWADSENWHIDQISTRGRLPSGCSSKTILLLGAGAVGSPLAELLVRSGVHRIRILDNDCLEVGNLARHTLGLGDVKTPKAEGVARSLNCVSPHATVEAINAKFPSLREADENLIQICDVILDCTGNDDVLHHLESFSWRGVKLFVSVSLGFQARRLFCFAASGIHFPHDIFCQAVEPWLRQEREKYSAQDLPREGVGCWHPVFPARADDVWMMASVAVKYLEVVMTTPPPRPEVVVFEQQYEQGVFVGIRRFSAEDVHV